MSTGACGIDCTVCRLHVLGVCSTCGAGTSREGRQKLAAQRRMFGQDCAVLACAVERRIGHCLRDCDDFPCPHCTSGEYPFSPAFLDMQGRRREQAAATQAAWPEAAPEFTNTPK